MVPRHFENFERLPQSPNGKVDRRALAAGVVAPSPALPDVEHSLLSIWRRTLQSANLDIDSDFFEAGGDSLLMFTMLTEVERLVGCRLPLDWCFNGPVTVRQLAMAVDRAIDIASGSGRDASASLVLIPLRTTGKKPPLFLIYADALALVTAPSLVAALDSNRPVYLIAPLWTEVTSRDDLVRDLASAIAKVTTGPAHLAGHSIGGLLVYETAALLEQNGHALGAVILVDTISPKLEYKSDHNRLRRRVRRALGIPAFWRKDFAHPADVGGYQIPLEYLSAVNWTDNPIPVTRPIDLLISSDSLKRYGDYLGWGDVHGGAITLSPVPGDHYAMLRSAHASDIARALSACFAAAESSATVAQR
jgi:thioesterase domain-containing protein